MIVINLNFDLIADNDPEIPKSSQVFAERRVRSLELSCNSEIYYKLKLTQILSTLKPQTFEVVKNGAIKILYSSTFRSRIYLLL